ncbi:MAG: hypothetical protein ACI9UJ_002428 [bacterium]|jgi:hypothetical protein
MKNIKFIITLFVLAVTLQSCETFDDFPEEREAVIGFTKASSSITVSAGQTTAEKELDIFVSDMSTSDRTFNIVVAEGSEVAAENYSFDGALTVLANEREAILVFTAIDISLMPDPQPLILAFEYSDDYASGGRITLNIKTNN